MFGEGRSGPPRLLPGLICLLETSNPGQEWWQETPVSITLSTNDPSILLDLCPPRGLFCIWGHATDSRVSLSSMDKPPNRLLLRQVVPATFGGGRWLICFPPCVALYELYTRAERITEGKLLRRNPPNGCCLRTINTNKIGSHSEDGAL